MQGQYETPPQSEYLVVTSAVDPLPPFLPQHVQCTDLKPIMLPKQLESVTKATQFPSERHRWNTNEEVAAVLIAFEHHKQWQSLEVKPRPPSGTMLLYNRKKVVYRKDGYIWKKRKDGKTTREDHMKLKVQGVECIYGCYVHSAILPTFHRRCYWLLQNPNIVLVHYLNVPLMDDSKPSKLPLALTSLRSASIATADAEGRKWTEEELLSQLKPMFASLTKPANATEQLTDETLRCIVRQLLCVQSGGPHAKCGCPQPGCHGNCRRNRIISPRGPSRKLPFIQPNRVGSPQVTSAQGMIINPTANRSNTPLILNLSQLHGNNGLIILSSQTGAPISVINNNSNGSTEQSALQSIQVATKDTTNPPPSTTSSVNLQNSAPIPQPLPTSQQTLPDFPSTTTADLTSILTEGFQDINSNVSSAPSLSTEHVQSLSLNDLDNTSHSTIQMDTTPLPEPPFPNTNQNLATTPGLMQSIEESKLESLSNMLGFEPQPNQTGSQPALHHQEPAVTSANLEGLVSPNSSDLDLDAFDILNLPDLDNFGTHLEAPISSAGVTSAPITKAITTLSSSDPKSADFASQNAAVNINAESRAGIANITDFSPDWAYQEGGTKILVTGPWYSTTSPYSVLFDGVSVPATLVQSGVLRCFCPSHVPGLVSMQVACEGYIISNSCAFEYKKQELSLADKQNEWFGLSTYHLQLHLIERFEELERRMTPLSLAPSAPQTQTMDGVENLESRMLEMCEKLMIRTWRMDASLIPSTVPRKLTILHLVAALGYTKLASKLNEWRSQCLNLVLEFEIDPLGLDDHSCTPLMWACARGHFEMAVILYQMNNSCLTICNRDGLLPVSLCRMQGHTNLADVLEKLETARREMQILKSEVKDEGEISHEGPKPLQQQQQQPQQQQPPIKMTLVKTSTGMVLAPLASPAEKPPAICIPVHIQPPATSTASLKPVPSAVETPKMGSLTINIPPSPPFKVNALQSIPDYTTQAERRLRFLKRTSVEVLPDYPNPKLPEHPCHSEACGGGLLGMGSAEGLKTSSPIPVSSSGDSMAGLRTSNSDPHLSGLSPAKCVAEISADPMISMSDRDLNSPIMFMQMDSLDDTGISLGEGGHSDSVAMETDSPRSDSPLVDVDGIPPIDVYYKDDGTERAQQEQMITLANQIIAAMPDRIKASPGPSDDLISDDLLTPASSSGSTNPVGSIIGSTISRDRSSSYGSYSSCSTTPPEDSGISTPLDGMSFEEYRYPDLGTPASSLSPASSCLQSPYSFSLDSPPPTAADFTEYFNAPTFYMEKDFSQLTLSDEEQRHLYHAAKIIQHFYRRYKDKKEQQQRQRQRQMEAAILIQSYYRRYKQYMYYKKMTQAAVLIQSQFRTYYAQKRFRKSREAATIIQNRYRAYKEHERYKKSRSAAVIIQQRFRSHYQRKRIEQGVASKVTEMMGDSSLSMEAKDSVDTEEAASSAATSDHAASNSPKPASPSATKTSEEVKVDGTASSSPETSNAD